MLSLRLLLLLLSVVFRPIGASARNIANLKSQNQAHTVFQFASGTWVENIAVRRNEDLLVTLVNRPELYLIDPLHGSARRVGNFRAATASSLLGTTEMASDVFAVITGNYSINCGTSVPKSYSVWEVNFNQGERCEKIPEIEKIPEASFPNGMATLNCCKDIVLISDSAQGVVWRLDVRTARYEIVLEDETMKPAPEASLNLAINGIRILGDYLYYINTLRELFCRVKIDLFTGKPSGPYEIVTAGISDDDFAISKRDIAYITENSGNAVERVNLNGEKTLVAEGLDSTLIPGATSAAFGRKVQDRNIPYDTTAEIQNASVNGNYTEGGKVVAIHI